MAVDQSGSTLPLQFVDEPSEDCKCRLCELVPLDPYLSKCCEVLVCGTCAVKVRKDGGVPCPISGCESKDFTVVESNNVKIKIRTLQAYCPNSPFGCAWKGRLPSLLQHQRKECTHAILPCPNACGMQGNPSAIHQHVREECQLRPFSCQYCSVKGTYQDIAGDHIPICPKLPLPCPNCCGSPEVAREDMEKHLSVCKLQGTAKSVEGYSHKFVEELSEDVKCLICLLVLRDPHLTECCGHNFCEYCITEARKRDSSCPHCRKEPFQSFRDLKEERKVLSLMVNCDYHYAGCTWTGTVKSIAEHISPKELEGECKYVPLSCPYSCGAQLRRSLIHPHIREECQLRPFSCQYCSVKGTYQDIAGNHIPICPKLPLPCPNCCGSPEVAREDMEKHLSVCELQVVPCTYRQLGCGSVLVRRDHPHHMREAAHLHLSMITHLLFVSNNQVISLAGELDATKKVVFTTRGHLDAVTKELGDTKGHLDAVTKELGDTKSQLAVALQRMDVLERIVQSPSSTVPEKGAAEDETQSEEGTSGTEASCTSPVIEVPVKGSQRKIVLKKAYFMYEDADIKVIAISSEQGFGEGDNKELDGLTGGLLSKAIGGRYKFEKPEQFDVFVLHNPPSSIGCRYLVVVNFLDRSLGTRHDSHKLLQQVLHAVCKEADTLEMPSVAIAPNTFAVGGFKREDILIPFLQMLTQYSFTNDAFLTDIRFVSAGDKEFSDMIASAERFVGRSLRTKLDERPQATATKQLGNHQKEGVVPPRADFEASRPAKPADTEQSQRGAGKGSVTVKIENKGQRQATKPGLGSAPSPPHHSGPSSVTPIRPSGGSGNVIPNSTPRDIIDVPIESSHRKIILKKAHFIYEDVDIKVVGISSELGFEKGRVKDLNNQMGGQLLKAIQGRYRFHMPQCFDVFTVHCQPSSISCRYLVVVNFLDRSLGTRHDSHKLLQQVLHAVCKEADTLEMPSVAIAPNTFAVGGFKREDILIPFLQMLTQYSFTNDAFLTDIRFVSTGDKEFSDMIASAERFVGKSLRNLLPASKEAPTPKKEKSSLPPNDSNAKANAQRRQESYNPFPQSVNQKGSRGRGHTGHKHS